MGIKTYKPYTPVRRFITTIDYSELTTDEPYKPLTKGFHRKKGRGYKGRITVRHKGGGHKRLYRIIDFKRDKRGIEAVVETIEYDPNRTAFISRVVYKDGERRYILAPYGIKVGDTIIADEKAPVKVGNALPLKNIPTGVDIHNIELKPGKGGQLVRAAGSAAQILAKEGKYCQVRLPSGEIRLIHRECYATVGRVSNIDNENITVGKAGRARWMGIRPTVRGVAMNPVDHPHGGGEGKQKGYKTPVTPWGQPCKGYKTRKKRNPSDKFIIRRRK